MIKTCLIGKKLGHSMSPVIHKKFYKEAGILGEYNLRETQEDKLGSLIEELGSQGYLGANVTIPYKTRVMKYLDSISEEALAIGAVNTIHFKDGKTYGYNSDYYGLKILLDTNNIDIKEKKVVVLGTGGASKCAVKLVSDMKASRVSVVSRASGDGKITYEELECLASIDVLINTTPVGMYPDILGCPVSDRVIKNCKSIVDVVYNPMKTVLIRKALAEGKRAIGGLMMLTAQAIKAQEIWTGKKPDETLYNKVYDFIKELKTNVVIIGMPGSGKSTIGKLAAKKLDMNFIDTDELIELEHGKIPDIFENEGEKVFREYESAAASIAADIRGVVIATGGGIVLNKENIDELKKSGIVFFIDRPLDILLEKTDASYRPLLSDDINKIKVLYNQRYSLYCKYADYIINNDKDVESCINEIKKIWEARI